MKKTPRAPQEDPSVKVIRERQLADLAKLDEEENRRLKAAFRISRGVRAFRPSAGGSAGSGGGSTSSGSRGPAVGGRGGGRAGSIGGGRRRSV